MKADKILNTVEDSFHHHYLQFDVIVGYNDSTMQDFPNITSRGVWVKWSSNKGYLNFEIPLTYFLTNPYHWVKVFDKHVFAIVRDEMDRICGWTKEDSLQPNKY